MFCGYSFSTMKNDVLDTYKKLHILEITRQLVIKSDHVLRLARDIANCDLHIDNEDTRKEVGNLLDQICQTVQGDLDGMLVNIEDIQKDLA
tara:strand:- start:1751 stop:2023 length:273 start_codon:yes stop_codon:yes gene_type:complete